MIEDDQPLQWFIFNRIEANNQRLVQPNFQRIVTPGILYLLHRSVKNNLPISGVVCALDPEMARLSESTLRKRIARALELVTDSRKVLTHPNITIKQQLDFMCHPVSKGMPEKPKIIKTIKTPSKSNRKKRTRSGGTYCRSIP
jgi:hypothetical protein